MTDAERSPDQAYNEPVNLDDYRTRPLHSGSGGGTSDGMEARVKALEDTMQEIRADLKTLLIDTTSIKATIASMPTAKEFGELKGRVDSLPTLPKLAALFAVAAGFLAFLPRIQGWIAGLGG